MAFRNLLLNRVPQLVNQHFGSIPEAVIYEGAVMVPSALTLDCKRLAQAVLAEEPDIAEVFSIEYVAQHLESIIVTTVREGTNGTLILIEQLCSRLEQRDEWKVVLIPLQGVKLTERIMEIGPFRLRKMDVDAIGEATALWNAAIDRTTNTPEEKESAKESFAKDLEAELSGGICLEVRLCSDRLQAEKTALQKATVLLDLLRYGCSGLHHKTVHPAFGFKGDGLSGVYRRYILPLGESGATNSLSKTGAIGELILDDRALQIMSDLGVHRLATALLGPMSDFELALLRSVHWFAESRVQLKPEYEVVALAVAVESALAVPGKESHGRNVLAEAVAVLLSENPDQRLQLYDLTRAALWQRGEVVHRGADATEWDALGDFRNVVLKFLTAAIRSTDRFTTCAELLSWVASRNAGLVKGR